jgi:hypothetical protein
MNLDVRLPIAWLFLIVGLLLAGYGIASPRPEVPIPHAFNLNLCWGSVMIFFALALLALVRWSGRSE